MSIAVALILVGIVLVLMALAEAWGWSSRGQPRALAPLRNPQREEQTSMTDETKGRVKKAAGELTGDDDLKREGTVDKVTGKAKDAADKIAEKAKGIVGKNR